MNLSFCDLRGKKANQQILVKQPIVKNGKCGGNPLPTVAIVGQASRLSAL